ncbi:hypothetical protein ACJX0J_042122, partial [Zea mays]
IEAPTRWLHQIQKTEVEKRSEPKQAGFKNKLEKHRRTDQGLKKGVLKLEFFLQESQSQMRKLKRDAEGNWHAGAITAAADDVCAAAIMSVEGIIKVSIHYDVSYFTTAKLHKMKLAVDIFLFHGTPFTEIGSSLDEVEMDGRVVEQKVRMTAVAVEIRKKESGELVAIGRQWMTASRPKIKRMTQCSKDTITLAFFVHRMGKYFVSHLSSTVVAKLILSFGLLQQLASSYIYFFEVEHVTREEKFMQAYDLIEARDGTKTRLLSLELLQGLLKGVSNVFIKKFHFIDSVKAYLSYALLRASVSSSPVVFQYACGMFSVLLLRFGESEEGEIGVFFPLIVLRSLDSSDSPLSQKERSSLKQVGVGLMIFQQLGGINVLGFYTSYIFSSAGFSGKLGTTLIGVIQMNITYTASDGGNITLSDGKKVDCIIHIGRT